MLGKMRTIFDSRRVLVVSAIVYTASQIAIGLILLPLGPARVLELQTSVSPEFISSVLGDWRAAGTLRIFINHFYLDFFHPLFYGALLLALMARLLNEEKAPSRWNWLLLAPVLAAAMDLCENILYVAFIADGTNITGLTSALSGCASITKWALSGISIAIIVALFVKRMIGRGERGGVNY
ncbi:MAG TPA: hypothetical protein PKY31_06915 [Spirochaetota bacterium]|nr:hypothetical protein [Spirochaetota bacterium]